MSFFVALHGSPTLLAMEPELSTTSTTSAAEAFETSFGSPFTDN